MQWSRPRASRAALTELRSCDHRVRDRGTTTGVVFGYGIIALGNGVIAILVMLNVAGTGLWLPFGN